MKTEAYFIEHCEPPCGLGFFNYTCPSCKKNSEDYTEVWDVRDKLNEGKFHIFECERCKCPLMVSLDADKWEYNVKIK